MNRHRLTTLEIQTPEMISFSLPLAGVVTRFVAWLVDLAVIIASIEILGMLLETLTPIAPGVVAGLRYVLILATMTTYGMLLEWLWRGQTIGKRLLGLRVIDEEGMRLQPRQLIIRNLLRPVDMLPAFCMVGGLICLFSRRAQRLGDLAGNTIVIRIPQSQEPQLDALLAGRFNSFRDYPHLESRLRRAISPDELAIAMQALVRRDELESDHRVKLFSEIAESFRKRVKFPSEATFGLTDEQYVRNILDSVYRQRAALEKLKRSKHRDEDEGSAYAEGGAYSSPGG